MTAAATIRQPWAGCTLLTLVRASRGELWSGTDVDWEVSHRCTVCGSEAWRAEGGLAGKRLGRCSECGTLRLVDRIAPHDLPRIYVGHYTPPEGATALEGQLRNPTFAWRRRRLERSIGDLPKSFMEIGCGDGNFLAVLRGHRWSVGGCEFDASAVAEVARRHGIAVTIGGIDALADADPVSAVGAYHVLEHVYDPIGWLDRVRRLLRPGGLLHVQVPNEGSLTRRLAGEDWWGFRFPQHVTLFRPASLERLLRASGFVPEPASTWDPWHGPGTIVASAVQVYRRRRTGRPTWSVPDEALDGAPGREAPSERGAARSVLSASLQLAAPVLARSEAAVGRGAVVDIVARRLD